jgi:hypothetical protein
MAEDQDASALPSIGQFARRHGASVVASVVASFLFLYLLNPILAFFGRSLLYVAARLNQAYLNRIYAQAAHLETQDFSFWLISIVVEIFSLLPLLMALSLLQGSRRYISHRVVSDVATRRAHDSDRPTATSESDLAQSLRRRPWRQVRASVAISFCVIGFLPLVFGGVIITANYVQLSLISSFRQHIRIVAPYVSDLEMKMLLSEWSRMEGKPDYDRVYDKLRGIAARAGVRLPENKLYSASAL